jgi:hypothetical protein
MRACHGDHCAYSVSDVMMTASTRKPTPPTARKLNISRNVRLPRLLAGTAAEVSTSALMEIDAALGTSAPAIRDSAVV